MQVIESDRVLYRPQYDDSEGKELLPALVMRAINGRRVDLCVFWPVTPSRVDTVLMQNVHLGEGPGEWRWRPDGAR